MNGNHGNNIMLMGNNNIINWNNGDNGLMDNKWNNGSNPHRYYGCKMGSVW